MLADGNRILCFAIVFLLLLTAPVHAKPGDPVYSDSFAEIEKKGVKLVYTSPELDDIIVTVTKEHVEVKSKIIYDGKSPGTIGFSVKYSDKPVYYSTHYSEGSPPFHHVLITKDDLDYSKPFKITVTPYVKIGGKTKTGKAKTITLSGKRIKNAIDSDKRIVLGNLEILASEYHPKANPPSYYVKLLVPNNAKTASIAYDSTDEKVFGNKEIDKRGTFKMEAKGRTWRIEIPVSALIQKKGSTDLTYSSGAYYDNLKVKFFKADGNELGATYVPIEINNEKFETTSYAIQEGTTYKAKLVRKGYKGVTAQIYLEKLPYNPYYITLTEHLTEENSFEPGRGTVGFQIWRRGGKKIKCNQMADMWSFFQYEAYAENKEDGVTMCKIPSTELAGGALAVKITVKSITVPDAAKYRTKSLFGKKFYEVSETTIDAEITIKTVKADTPIFSIPTISGFYEAAKAKLKESVGKVLGITDWSKAGEKMKEYWEKGFAALDETAEKAREALDPNIQKAVAATGKKLKAQFANEKTSFTKEEQTEINKNIGSVAKVIKARESQLLYIKFDEQGNRAHINPEGLSIGDTITLGGTTYWASLDGVTLASDSTSALAAVFVSTRDTTNKITKTLNCDGGQSEPRGGFDKSQAWKWPIRTLITYAPDDYAIEYYCYEKQEIRMAALKIKCETERATGYDKQQDFWLPASITSNAEYTTKYATKYCTKGSVLVVAYYGLP